MAFAMIRFSTRVAIQATCRSFSTVHPKIEKSVFISQSHDIFSNLALEDWIYKKWDLSQHHVMLLWRNEPCVVIGRHQNPWTEADPEFLELKGIPLARRNSGGGAVYHDKGNLNITFFTPRDRYNREENLQLLVTTIRDNWGLDVKMNERHDIVLDSSYKILQVSGTASKLGRPNAYHHCTLMVDVDKEELSAALDASKSCTGLNTNATKSVRSSVKNLSEAIGSGGRSADMESLMTALGWAYLASDPVTAVDGGWSQVSNTRGFQLVNPTDEWFPGVGSAREELSSWDWTWGKTPRFQLRREVGGGVGVEVEVEAGIVAGVVLEWAGERAKVISSLLGHRFSPALLRSLLGQVASQAPALLAASAHSPTAVKATA